MALHEVRFKSREKAVEEKSQVVSKTQNKNLSEQREYIQRAASSSWATTKDTLI
jgi:hypothetical protein